MVAGKHFEELSVGNKFTSIARTITETDLVNFVTFSGTFEELFTSAEYVEKHSIFKKRIVPGMLTLVVSMGLNTLVGWLQGTGMALMGVDGVRMIAPVACGDTIRAEAEIVDKKETSRPDRGVIRVAHTVRNQHGETVMSYFTTRMVRRLGAAQQAS